MLTILCILLKVSYPFQAVIIQKYYRRWLAKRRADTIREAERVRQEWEKQEEILKKKEKEARIQKEYERRMNPKSKEDFDLLYHALESMLHSVPYMYHKFHYFGSQDMVM